MDWHDHYEAALRALRNVEDHVESDPLAALRWLAKTTDHFGDIAIPLAQSALDQGATKTAIAKALNVPPSYLRGMEKTRQPTAKAKNDGPEALKEMLRLDQ
jgi:ABC-type microcin C transport system permease subunit YejB